jgi:hypothetical protein
MESALANVREAEFLGDFERGLADHELVHKYGLSAQQLRLVFQGLLHMRKINAVDFEAWQIFHNESVPLDIRLYPRTILNIRPALYETANPNNKGIIVNISQYGLESKGITGITDRMMTLTVPPAGILKPAPFSVRARCKWTRPNPDDGILHCGFYVVLVDGTDWESVCSYLRSLESQTVDSDGRSESEASDVASGTSGP